METQIFLQSQLSKLHSSRRGISSVPPLSEAPMGGTLLPSSATASDPADPPRIRVFISYAVGRLCAAGAASVRHAAPDL